MRYWLYFGGLGLIWGSSFLLIKVAVKDFGPLPLVSLRIGLAALFMAVFIQLTGRRWPTLRREQAALLFVGIINTAVPFTLITWGEKDIDSGLATVLNATVPLFTLIFAHVGLPDEQISPKKVLGLALGFVGVALLASRTTASSSPNPLSGQVAVLLASACYGLSAVVIRRYLRALDPFTIAGGSLIIGAVAIIAVTLTTTTLPRTAALSFGTTLAVVVLALVNTVLAYFLFYSLLSTWGATRTTLVTYLMPPVGVTLGAIFLDEVVDWKIVGGAVLILIGIVVVNWHRKQTPVTRPAPTTGNSS